MYKLLDNTLDLIDIEYKEKGLARFMHIKRRNCKFKHSFYTPPQIVSTEDNCSRGMKAMEINVRAVYGFRSIGVGHAPITKLYCFLNMPPSINKNAYDGQSYAIKFRSKQVAEKCFSDSATRLRGTEKAASFYRRYVTGKRCPFNQLE